MATIKIIDLSAQAIDRIQAEELFDVVSNSVARAIKARGINPQLSSLSDPTRMGYFPEGFPVPIKD